MIELRGLSKHFGPVVALEPLDLDVPEGQVLALLGPNGAGKSSTLRMLAGSLRPSAGSVAIGGFDLARQGEAARRLIGYLPENVAIYPELRVGEYLELRADLAGLDRRRLARRRAEVIDRCLLGEVRDRVVGTLSKGFRQRVALAAALIAEPQVLLLDEPTEGLDPEQIVRIRELLIELGREHTVIVSSHLLAEVELIAERVVILSRGKVLADATPRALRRRGRSLRVAFEPDCGVEVAAIEGLEGVETVEREGEAWSLSLKEGTEIRSELFTLAAGRGWPIWELSAVASLESVFLELVAAADRRQDEESSIEVEP